MQEFQALILEVQEFQLGPGTTACISDSWNEVAAVDARIVVGVKLGLQGLPGGQSAKRLKAERHGRRWSPRTTELSHYDMKTNAIPFGANDDVVGVPRSGEACISGARSSW